MNSLLASLAVVSSGGLIQILVYVAIAAIVIWAVIALVKWSGLPIPQPVIIVFTAFVGIFLILLMARAIGWVSW
jgi:hypothetical protein